MGVVGISVTGFTGRLTLVFSFAGGSNVSRSSNSGRMADGLKADLLGTGRNSCGACRDVGVGRDFSFGALGSSGGTKVNQGVLAGFDGGAFASVVAGPVVNFHIVMTMTRSKAAAVA